MTRPDIKWLALAAILPLLLALAGTVRLAAPRSRSNRPHARPNRFARRRDLRPLLVRHPTEGRLTLGHLGRWILAAPVDRPGTTSRRTATASGGAVALIGPSRSGKTTTAVRGILDWTGPAILASVKGDLLAATAARRRDLGEVRVYDPTHSAHGLPLASWSPLLHADTLTGSQRAARALTEAAPGGDRAQMTFWHATAEILLSGLLHIARISGHDMSDVCAWVLTQDHPSSSGSGTLGPLLDTLSLDKPSVDLQRSTTMLHGIWELDDRTRSSVYSTAQTLIWPWCDAGIAALAIDDPLRRVTLDWLRQGNNTLYLCSPIADQRRLSPAFSGLLNDLIGQLYRCCQDGVSRLNPPLLIVIDEAGNTPLQSLPEYASTLAGFGVMLVTSWQSLAQMHAEHGPRADILLGNHLTKCFFPGISDPGTLRYLDDTLGSEATALVSTTRDSSGRVSHHEARSERQLLPAHAIRQMARDRCLILHGSFPPALTRMR